MDIAKIFTNGGSQAVRLPKDCRFEDNEVQVAKIGSVVMLIPMNKNTRWNNMLHAIDMFTDDFLSDMIEALPTEEREVLI